MQLRGQRLPAGGQGGPALLPLLEPPLEEPIELAPVALPPLVAVDDRELPARLEEALDDEALEPWELVLDEALELAVPVEPPLVEGPELAAEAAQTPAAHTRPPRQSAFEAQVTVPGLGRGRLHAPASAHAASSAARRARRVTAAPEPPRPGSSRRFPVTKPSARTAAL